MSSQLSDDIEIEGDLNCGSDLVFNGKIKGNITCKTAVTIGKSAKVEGNVKADKATIEGNINGSGIFKSCDVTSEATISGKLQSAKIHVQEGATLDCQFEVVSDKSPKG